MKEKESVERFYATSEKAFVSASNPCARFTSNNHERCLAALCTSLAREEGLVLLAGDPGVGKTTLSEEVGGLWRQHCGLVGEVTNTQVGADDFLRLIAYAFGINARGSASSAKIKLEKLLRRQQARCKPSLLIVDEAQELSTEAVEVLRLLSNLGAGYRPTLRILLVAHHRLLARLHHSSLDSLRQHLGVVVRLYPLDVHETRRYIGYQMHKADWRGFPTITSGALQAVYQFTRGVPRSINVTMRYLLRLGADERLTVLDVFEVDRVVAELKEQNLILEEVSQRDERDLIPADQATAGSDIQSVPVIRKVKEFRLKTDWMKWFRNRLPSLEWASLLDFLRSWESKLRGQFRHINSYVSMRMGLARSPSLQGGIHGVPPPPGAIAFETLKSWIQLVARNRAVSIGLVVMLALIVGVSYRHPSAPGVALAKMPAQKRLNAGMLHASSLYDAVLPSKAADFAIHVDPAVEAKGVVAFAEDIRYLNSRGPIAAVPGGESGIESQQVSNLLLFAGLDQLNPIQVDSMGLTPGRPPPSTVPPLLSTLPAADPVLPDVSVGEEAGEWPLELAQDEIEVVLPSNTTATIEEAIVLQVSAEPVTAGGNAIGTAPRQLSKVEQLLQDAAAAIAKDQLTLPPERNAYRYYMAILSEEPRNQRARAGLDRIVMRYLELARHELEDGKLVHARRLVKRGLKVMADDSELLALAGEIDGLLKPVEPKPPAIADEQPEPLDRSVAEKDPTAHHPFEL